MKQQTQTYNDGVVSIYEVDNIAEPGNMAKDGLKIPAKVENLHYEERIVGMGRFYTALQKHVKIDRLIRVPRLGTISSQDIAIPTDGKQYKIKQIQYVPEVEPPSMDLSLERVEAEYEIG
jgi:hypothetical protein